MNLIAHFLGFFFQKALASVEDIMPIEHSKYEGSCFIFFFFYIHYYFC